MVRPLLKNGCKGTKGENMKDYKDIPLLKPNDIEVKVKQVSEKGAVVLLYKTARVDYRILNEMFGLYGWKNDYKDIKGNLFCTISLYDEEHSQWVEKVNCGVESRADEDGNEKKGEASDAFKRAGFALGIGVELYSAPFTFVKVATQQDNLGKWRLANKFQTFSVSEIDYNKDREISKLVIVDDKGEVVYSYGSTKKVAQPKAEEKKQDGFIDLHKDDPITKEQLDEILLFYYHLSEERQAKCNNYLKTKLHLADFKEMTKGDADSFISTFIKKV